MRVEARSPGGLRIETEVCGFRIATDQPVKAGGNGSAPSPFDLFVASLAACGAYYAVHFCRHRGIATEDLSLAAEVRKDPATGRVAEVLLDLELPPGFPERYRTAILRAVDQCTVKRALESPPLIRTRLLDPAPV